MERIVREFEDYQNAEAENLRNIRRHRARKNEWRHQQRVRRIRGKILGAILVAGGTAITYIGDGYGLISVAFGIAVMCVPELMTAENKFGY